MANSKPTSLAVLLLGLMEAFMSKNLSTVLESCVERMKEGLERALARAMEWTLHQTEEDAVSELGRAEVVFLMAVSALAHLDAEVSGMLLKEIERWSVFPRIKKYMSGKMDAEWEVPREMLDRASRFAHVLEVSGLFFVPPELRAYLAELLAEDEGHHAGAENNSQEGAAGGSAEASERKRPRKDPRGSQQGAAGGNADASERKRPRKDPRGSQQVEESSVGGEPQQERHYRLRTRRRRSLKQVGQGKEKAKQAPSHQQVLTPILHNIDRSVPEPTPGPSKIQMPSYPLHTDKPTRSIPKVPQVSKEEAQRRMWKGVKEDNAELIEGAVLCGADMEEEGEKKMTALTLAAWEGRLAAVRALVRLGARLEGRDGMDQCTALHWASDWGREEVVRLLLAAGANVEAEDEDCETPLHGASMRGHLSITRLLVEAGADINHRNNDGDTPLTLAQFYSHSTVAKYLRSVGAIE